MNWQAVFNGTMPLLILAIARILWKFVTSVRANTSAINSLTSEIATLSHLPLEVDQLKQRTSRIEGQLTPRRGRQ